jgi:ATP-dependent DNA ligase
MRCATCPLLPKLQTDKCPFYDLPEKAGELFIRSGDEMQNWQWLKPLLVAQIDFNQRTSDGHLRHASFVALR